MALKFILAFAFGVLLWAGMPAAAFAHGEAPARARAAEFTQTTNVVSGAAVRAAVQSDCDCPDACGYCGCSMASCSKLPAPRLVLTHPLPVTDIVARAFTSRIPAAAREPLSRPPIVL